jgi:hypothetical protein
VIRRIEEEVPGDDALALDARALRLVAARRRYDETLGILAREFREGRCHAILGYSSFDEYCEERLGMRAGTVRQRIWLEGRMRELPPLREALSSGRIGYAQSLVIARRATPANVLEWISRADKTTCQQLEREAQAEEDREHRAKGTRKLWSPSDAAQTVRDAIAAAQRRARALGGAAIDAGEALAVIADHFAEVKEAHMAPRRRRMPEFRRRALMRKGGLCAVPGCSRAAVHVHHVVFRSRGGKDEPWNGVALCAVHHLHGIHLGYLEVTGRAGERLHWKFAAGEAVPTEEWVTLGDDDVHRADAAGATAGGGAAAGGPGPPRGGTVTDVEPAERRSAAAKPAGPAFVTNAEPGAESGVVSEGHAATLYLGHRSRTDDRRWIVACGGGHAA